MANATAVEEAPNPTSAPDIGAIDGSRHGAPPAPDFVAELHRMSPTQRFAAYKAGLFSLRQAMTWAAHYPEEVPTVNGEFEWIALTLADLD